MMGHRQRLSATEYDAFSRWRHYLRWRPGERAAVKRGARRRERRDAKRAVRGGGG